MKRITVLFCLLIEILLAGCDPCLNSNCSDEFYFKIVNKNTGEDLVFGNNHKYNQDSIRFQLCADTALSGNCGFYSTVYTNDNILYATPNYTADTVYLRLSNSDFDTIKINYEYIESRCCKVTGFGKILSISYNNEMALKDGKNYLFKKR